MSQMTEETGNKLTEAIELLVEEVSLLRQKLDEGVNLEASVSDTLHSLTYQLKEMNSKND